MTLFSMSNYLSTSVFQSDDEREMCSRTIYCTNIDKKVSDNSHIIYSIFHVSLIQLFSSFTH